MLPACPQAGPVAVAVPGKFYLTLHYNSPQPVAVGARVRVTVGRQPRVGVVIDHSPAPTKVKLKNLEAVVDQQPLFDSASLQLMRWASNYYAYPLGDLICSCLPTRLSQGLPATVSSEKWFELKSKLPTNAAQQLSRATAQKALFNELTTQALTASLLKQRGHKTTTLNALQKRGWINQREQPNRCTGNPQPMAGPSLTTEQQQAIEKMGQPQQAQTYLLQGVTGSGKTEVYIRLCEQVLAQAKSVLLLVPEIGLTPQFLGRIQARLSAAITVLHSSLNARQRSDHWLFAQSGEARIVIGTRSAIFTPIPNLGLIVVDEEHDAAFKQQEQIRYHARDLAVVRAHQANIPVVLGSATPSSETLANVERGHYQRFTLTQRANQAAMPRIQAIDLRSQKLNNYLSPALIKQIKKHTEAGNQSLLFLNRRGISPVLICHECGWSADCPRCNTRLTLHRGGYQDRLHCHHCNFQQTAASQCQACGSLNLVTAGTGTAGLEETLTQLFPNQRILRIDRDNTRNNQQLNQALAKASNGTADILIGTQMMAKGHHFPKLTLVGIVDADGGLYSSDYRAGERLAQQIIQVAGRAGREQPGEVFIQTHQPQHSLIQQLLSGDYQQAISTILQERKQTQLPPYGYLALLRIAHKRAEKAQAFAHAINALAQQLDPNAAVLGPIAAPHPKLNNLWRFQVLIQTPNRAQRSALLSQLVPQADQHKLSSGVRWSVDVDPIDLM